MRRNKRIHSIAAQAEFRKDKELRSIPICIITGKPELRKLIYEHPDSPPNGYIDKPINEKDLILNIKKILEVGHQDQVTIN